MKELQTCARVERTLHTLPSSCLAEGAVPQLNLQPEPAFSVPAFSKKEEPQR